MAALNPLTASLDEIIFEGRNQAYGAFVLRRLYDRHLQSATAIAVALFLLLISSPLLVRLIWPDAVVISPVPPTEQVITLTKIDLPAQKPAGRAAVVTPVVRPPAELVPRVVPNDQVVDKPVDLKPVTPIVDNSEVPEGTQTGPVAQAGSGVGQTGSGTDSNATASKPVAPPKPFLTADVMPVFAGGDKAMAEYFRRNLRYPSLALRNQIAGRVFVSFTVSAAGDVQDVQVVKGLGFGTDEEAERVIRKMPPWQPGLQAGHAVPVRFTLPITFHFE